MCTYHEILEASIRHLEGLKAQGARFVSVSPETLAALGQANPVPRPSAGVAQAENPTLIQAPSPLSPLKPPTATPGAEAQTKAQAMAALREQVIPCVKCSHLASSRRSVVFGVGDVNSPLMFIGEAPGADEDKQGEPFVGRAGQLLTRIIQAMGFAREGVYIANILKCRPDTPGQSFGNRKPTPEEMATCIPYLQQQIDLIQPKAIVALGATAVEGLLARTIAITHLRGQWQSYRAIPLMPTFHPSFLLRPENGDKKRLVWEDMLQVMEKLGLPISDKQRSYFLKSEGPSAA
jgi:DNA polymerase